MTTDDQKNGGFNGKDSALPDDELSQARRALYEATHVTWVLTQMVGQPSAEMPGTSIQSSFNSLNPMASEAPAGKKPFEVRLEKLRQQLENREDIAASDYSAKSTNKTKFISGLMQLVDILGSFGRKTRVSYWITKEEATGKNVLNIGIRGSVTKPLHGFDPTSPRRTKITSQFLGIIFAEDGKVLSCSRFNIDWSDIDRLSEDQKQQAAEPIAAPRQARVLVGATSEDMSAG